MERGSPIKHELWSGEVFAMAGASFVHNQIVANLTATLVQMVHDGPCVVLSSDMKVYVPLSEGYVYPDVSLVCDEPTFVDEAGDAVSNPRVIIEVLSESTERFDRGEKFVGYRSLPSVTDYLLVAQDRARVEHYVRGSDDTWVLRQLGSGAAVTLAGIGGSLSVDAIYHKVAVMTPRGRL